DAVIEAISSIDGKGSLRPLTFTVEDEEMYYGHRIGLGMPPKKGLTAMEQLHRTTVQYYLRTGPKKELRSFGFDYIPVPRLPRGRSREGVFRRAIATCEDVTLRPILNDLYRWLVFSNFAGFTTHTSHGTREETLQTMDEVYPYCGALREAENFEASYHPWG